MLHQRVDGALGRSIRRQGPDRGVRRQRGQQNDAAAFPRIGSNCWTRKNGARTLTAKSLSKSSTVVSSIVAAFETPALAIRMSRRSPTIREPASPAWAPVRRGEVGGDGIGAAAGLPDFRDDGFGLLGAASVMDEHCAPALASAIALARPMPREAPVTRAVFPESVVMVRVPFLPGQPARILCQLGLSPRAKRSKGEQRADAGKLRVGASGRPPLDRARRFAPRPDRIS